jgi:hypothetical protein
MKGMRFDAASLVKQTVMRELGATQKLFLWHSIGCISDGLDYITSLLYGFLLAHVGNLIVTVRAHVF